MLSPVPPPCTWNGPWKVDLRSLAWLLGACLGAPWGKLTGVTAKCQLTAVPLQGADGGGPGR